MRSLFFSLAVTFLLFSCETNVIKSEYRSLDGAVWNKEEVLQFTFSEMDTLQEHDIYINVRNDNTFAYSNLFIIAALTSPEGRIVKDTLEYVMAEPDGTWLGKGNGSLKENTLWYKENIVFPTSGVYTIEVSHAMRKNGDVSGIIGLEGITDVGIEILKSNP
ncbi:MAG: gliding motility lipoprotein GldH [Maribacter sp.]